MGTDERRGKSCCDSTLPPAVGVERISRPRDLARTISCRVPPGCHVAVSGEGGWESGRETSTSREKKKPATAFCPRHVLPCLFPPETYRRRVAREIRTACRVQNGTGRKCGDYVVRDFLAIALRSGCHARISNSNSNSLFSLVVNRWRRLLFVCQCRCRSLEDGTVGVRSFSRSARQGMPVVFTVLEATRESRMESRLVSSLVLPSPLVLFFFSSDEARRHLWGGVHGVRSFVVRGARTS